MSEIKYHPEFDDKDKEKTIKMFEAFDKDFPNLPPYEPKEIPIPCVVRIDWACIWNSPKKVGELATAVAQRDQLTVVVFKDQSINMYRNEDLTRMVPKIKEDEGSH